MEKNNILTAEVLDIIFDGRNKLYGAYQLRKTYNKRLVKALSLTFFLVLLAFVGKVLSTMTVRDVPDGFLVTEIRSIKKADAPLPPPPVPPKVVRPQEVNQIKFVKPTIVDNDEVREDEKIQEIEEGQAISNITVESDLRADVVQAPVDVSGSTVIAAPKGNTEDSVFTSVQIEAAFPGGPQAWTRYLVKNLNPNASEGAPPGTYRVIVRFIVSKEGGISDVSAETKHGFGMEEEAVKIIQRGPRWIPALQNGKNVNAYRRQPITFIVDGE